MRFFGLFGLSCYDKFKAPINLNTTAEVLNYLKLLLVELAPLECHLPA